MTGESDVPFNVPSCHWTGNYKKCKKAQTFRFFVLIVARNIFQKKGGYDGHALRQRTDSAPNGHAGIVCFLFVCVGPFFISKMFHVKHSQAKHFFFIARNIFWQKPFVFLSPGENPSHLAIILCPVLPLCYFLFLLIFGRFCFKNSQTVFSSPTPFCFYGKFCICKVFVADVLL